MNNIYMTALFESYESPHLVVAFTFGRFAWPDFTDYAPSNFQWFTAEVWIQS